MRNKIKVTNKIKSSKGKILNNQDERYNLRAIKISTRKNKLETCKDCWKIFQWKDLRLQKIYTIIIKTKRELFDFRNNKSIIIHQRSICISIDLGNKIYHFLFKRHWVVLLNDSLVSLKSWISHCPASNSPSSCSISFHNYRGTCNFKSLVFFKFQSSNIRIISLWNFAKFSILSF